MPSGFGDLTDHAHHLVSTGDLAGAQRLLADALTDADPRPANATPELAEAASLQARVLVALGDPQAARGWAAYAYAATSQLHGRSDERTVAAAATLAAVLHRVGSWSRASRLYQEVIIELTALDGPEALRVLAAHADLATVEYARGQCQVARDRLADAWELHREVYGEGHPSGIKMLARLGAMQRDCGLFGEAHESLALAQELCRQHLPPDDPLAAQVTTLAWAAADPEHRCADPAVGRDTPIVPTARMPLPGDGPHRGAPHPSQSGYRSAGPYLRPELAGHDLAGHPANGYAPPASVPTPRQPVDGNPPSADEVWRPHEHGTDAPWPPEHENDGPWPPEHETGNPWPPEHDTDGRWPAEHDGDHRRPPEHAGADEWAPTHTDEAWRPVAPAEDRTSAVPPYVLPLAGAETAPGVHQVRGHPDAEEQAYQPSRLLPVLVPRTPAPPATRRLPLVVAGVAVVLLGSAAVIAGVARFDDALPAATGTPAPTSTASTPATARPATAAPASAVSLRDSGDNVTLRWTYPAGGEGPVVISGGRAGQPQAVFANLPAGTTDFVVYGLNRSTDYCFTVAVVWSTETIARSKEVCTDRN